MQEQNYFLPQNMNYVETASFVSGKFGFYPIGGTGISLLLFLAKVVVKAKYPAGGTRIIQ